MLRRPLPILAAVLLAGCATPAATRPRVNHIVLFELADPADAAALVRDCDARLATIPGVVSSFAGTHLETGRPGVLSDYDVAFYAGFMTEDEYRAYLEHPAHVEAVEKWRPRLRSLRIYDVLTGTGPTRPAGQGSR